MMLGLAIALHAATVCFSPPAYFGQLSILPLALLKAGIFFVYNVQLTFPAYNFAVSAAFFNGCSNFHNYLFLP